ncbi:hypothetical protein J7L67_06220 [bacterium]|nr:hypothetical protein [bacterium]
MLKKFFYFITACFLLPVCCIVCKIFFLVLVSSDKLWICFSSGFALSVSFVYIKGYIGRVYIFFHELNHAFWSALAGIPVTDFSLDKKGGHIEVERLNVIAALGPYFFSIPFAVLIIFHSSLIFFTNPHPLLLYSEYTACGFFIGWHIVTSFHVIRLGQNELKRLGVFFSICAILFIFLFLNGIFLSILSPNFYLANYFKLSYKETINIYSKLFQLIINAYNQILK